MIISALCFITNPETLLHGEVGVEMGTPLVLRSILGQVTSKRFVFLSPLRRTSGYIVTKLFP